MVQITKYKQGRYKKTKLEFFGNDGLYEGIDFFNNILKSWSKSEEMLSRPQSMALDIINPKKYIIDVIKVFQKWKGTNAVIECNRPLKVTFNGFFDF